MVAEILTGLPILVFDTVNDSEVGGANFICDVRSTVSGWKNLIPAYNNFLIRLQKKGKLTLLNQLPEKWKCNLVTS